MKFGEALTDVIANSVYRLVEEYGLVVVATHKLPRGFQVLTRGGNLTNIPYLNKYGTQKVQLYRGVNGWEKDSSR
jgi:hypothetical protein